MPTFFNHKNGLIRMVNTFSTEDFLKQAIESNISIAEVKDLKRQIINNKTKLQE